MVIVRKMEEKMKYQRMYNGKPIMTEEERKAKARLYAKQYHERHREAVKTRCREHYRVKIRKLKEINEDNNN